MSQSGATPAQTENLPANRAAGQVQSEPTPALDSNETVVAALAMKAVVFETYGPPNVLKAVELPAPVPREGEAFVRVTAIGVNPADAKWRSGLFEQTLPLDLPYVPGYDIAARVESGTGFAAGTRVMAMLDVLTGGAYAEFVVVPEDRLTLIPSGLSDEAAAALPTPALTGLQLIEQHVRPGAGERVLITGAVGSVGRFAVHATKARGARVIAAVREHQREVALALGADEVVIFGSNNAPRIDHVADTVGGSDVALLCQSVGPSGRIRTVSTNPIPPEGLQSLPEFIQVRPNSAQLAKVAAAVAAGEIDLPVGMTLPLREAAEAHRILEEGTAGGKIVLIP